MKIVIMGPKGSGKSTVGAALSEIIGLPAFETDTLIEEKYAREQDVERTCREIFIEHGEAFFRDLEKEVAAEAAALNWCLILTGGSLMLDPDSRFLLRNNAILVYLTADPEALWERATWNGVAPWLQGEDGPTKHLEKLAFHEEVLLPFADIVVDTSEFSAEELAEETAELIAQEMSLRGQAGSTFGEVIRMTTFGESHGKAIGVILDGLRPGIPISEEEIQAELDRRKPGQSKLVTRRKESDTVHILSGVFEGKTTGASIAMVIYNEDQKSKSYAEIENLFRPGHADYTFYKKYGIRDHRGGGRSSGRETACRVACGAIAKGILKERGVKIVAHAVEVAGIGVDTCDHEVIEQNPVRCADPVAAEKMAQAIMDARKDCDSVGGVIQLEITGVPAGLGDPVFAKLDARLAAAMMSLGAVKGVEVGDGFAQAKLRGSESNDNIADGNFLTNHAGGILGGMSNGDTIRMRIAVKPTSSIARKQRTITKDGENTDIEVHGRHDPCIVPRAVPVVEDMAAMVLLDAWEIQERINPEWITE